MSEKIAVIILKFEPRYVCPSDAVRMANSMDLDQTAPSEALKEQSDQGLHCCVRKLRINTV